jgi:hypothetical protein
VNEAKKEVCKKDETSEYQAVGSRFDSILSKADTLLWKSGVPYLYLLDNLSQVFLAAFTFSAFHPCSFFIANKGIKSPRNFNTVMTLNMPSPLNFL